MIKSFRHQRLIQSISSQLNAVAELPRRTPLNNHVRTSVRAPSLIVPRRHYALELLPTYRRLLERKRRIDAKRNIEDWQSKPPQTDQPPPPPPLYQLQKDSPYPVQQVIKVGRHTKVTAGGRIFSFSTTVVIGTGNGVAGFGYGRGMTAPVALRQAIRDAEKNMFAIPRLKTGGILRGFKSKNDGVTVLVMPRRPGGGRRVGSFMGIICDAFGLDDVSMKAFGTRERNSMVRAVFKGLYENAVSEKWQAEALGRAYYPRSAQRDVVKGAGAIHKQPKSIGRATKVY